PPASRAQFERYRQSLHEPRGDAPGKHRITRRERTAMGLVRSFLGMLKGYRAATAFALGTLTVATILALIPPAATKFVVDWVLNGQPLPQWVPDWMPRDPWPLLLTITGIVIAISLVKMLLHIWGRWHATRITKLVQMSV